MKKTKVISANKKHLVFIGFLFILIGIYSCSGIGKYPNDKKESLKAKVEQLCQAKQKGEWEKVYDLMTPAFKKATSKENFLKKKRNMKLSSFKIDEIQINESGDKATVKILWDIEMLGYKFQNAPEIQHWEFVQGHWYYSPKKRKKGNFINTN